MPTLTRTPLRRNTTAHETPYDRSKRLLLEKQNLKLIDKNDLDEEWVRHPQIVREIADEAALAESYRDQAEADVEKAEAKADATIRSNAGSAGTTAKTTEGQIRSMVALDPGVWALKDHYREWKLLAKLWSNLSKEFDARQYALRDLSQLWAKGYWASHIGNNEREAATERIAAQVRRQGTS
jgi:hypothetical protein